MRQRNYKIILTVTIGFLLSFSVANAKNFNIFNAASPSQSYFTVNGTSGNVGIGITNPTTLLQILNNGWISAQNAAGTGVVNMFKVNASNQIEVGAPLNIGSFEFSPDSGLVSFVDMPVTSGAASGTPEGYAFKVDGDNIMTAYSESNGAGGIQNKRLGIGLTNPAAALDVSGSLRNTLATTHSLLGGAGEVLVMADNTGALYTTSTAGFLGGGTDLWGGTKNANIWNGDAGAGNVGIGTTNPVEKLDVYTSSISTIAQFKNLKTQTPFSIVGGTDIGQYWRGSFIGQNIILDVATGKPAINVSNYRAGAIGFAPDNTEGYIGFLTTSATTTGTNLLERMRITDVGNVGIGVTNPGAKLGVSGNAIIGANWGRSTLGLSVIASYNNSAQSSPGDADRTLHLENPDNTTGSFASLTMRAGNDGNASWYHIMHKKTGASAGTALHFVQATQVMALTSGGNVGIGTTVPNQLLEVAGATSTIKISDTTSARQPQLELVRGTIDTFGADGYTDWRLYVTAGDLRFLRQDNGGNSGDTVTFGALGNVGIGTTNPTTKLYVAGTSLNTLATTHSLLGGAGNVVVMADNTGALYATSTASLLSGGSSLWSGTLDGTIWNGTAGSGNVGIGTTTPSTKLQIVTSGTNGVVIGDTAYPSWMGAEGLYVDGAFRANSYLVNSGGTINWGASTAQIVGYSLSTSDTNSYIGFLTGETGNHYERMRIVNNGNIGIGTTAPGAKLEVATNTSTLAQLRISGAYNTASSGSEIFLRESDPSDYGFKIGLESSNNRFYITSINGATVAERLSIQRDTGNIGIGTVTPLGKLDITGTQSDTLGEGAIRITNSVDAQRAFAIRLTADTVSDLTFDREYASSWSEALRIKRLDGNVGIGTTNPGTKLDVSGTLRNTLATTHSLLGGAGNVVVMADNTGALYATSTASLMSGGTNFWGGTLNGNIWNGDAGVGNVGIGTTNPGSKLTLKGDLAVEGTSTTSNAILNFTTPYYGRLNYSVTPNNGKSEVRFVSKGSTAGAGQTYFVIASTEAADTGNNLLLGVASSRAFIANAVNYSAGGALHLGGASWSADGVVQISGLPTDLTGKMTVIGNVGIGTTAPAVKLEVRNQTVDNTPFQNLQTIFANVSNESSGESFTEANASFGLSFRRNWNGGADSSNVGGIYGFSSANYRGGMVFRTKNNTSATGTTDITAMMISPAGNVGISTTNPTTKLYVAGTSLNTLATTHSLLGGSGDVVIMADNTGTLYATSTASLLSGGTSLWSGTKNGNIWNGDSGAGNIGIGTTNPISQLELYKNTGAGLRITGDVNSTSTLIDLLEGTGAFGAAGTYGFRILYNGSSNYFNLNSGNGTMVNTRMAIDRDTGNVGLGVATPGAKLDINQGSYGLPQTIATSTQTYGALRIQAASGGNVTLDMGNGGSSSGAWLQVTNRTDLSLAYSLLLNPNGGNVGVGTTNPGTKLDVSGTLRNTLATTHSLLGGGGDVLVMADNSGNLYATSTAGFIGGSGSYLPLTGGSLSGNLNMGGNNITNVNKLTVNTIDPLYNIQGINYSTFASSIAGGVKEEYLGRVKINKLTADGEREYIIDFDNLTKGSDLWVWRKTVDFSIDNVEVIATPYGNFAQVYYKIEDNKIIFRADRPTTISYRLSGRRIDWRNWPTKALDQEEKAGFVIE